MRYFFFVVGVVILYAGFVMPASASTVAVTSATTSVQVGEIFSITVTDDTEQQSINAVEAVVTWASDQFEFVSADNSHSVLSLWIESPVVRNKNEIHFSGIAPGGFTASDTPLITLLFKAVHTGQATFTLGQTKNLLNDGAGTEAIVKKRDLQVRVTDGQAVPVIPTKESELPEHFSPIFVTDSDLYDNADTLIFSTTDKGSGLDHFEIKEGLSGTYNRVTSPYQIRDKSRTQSVTIKAIDRAGNERIERFYPQNFRPWYQQRQIIGGILIGCLLVLSLFFILSRKNWRRRPRSS